VAVAENGARPKIAASLPLLGLAALGVVFGDIGTSPLYTLKTVLNLAGDKPDAFTVLGSLSLVIWTLIIITSVKYVTFAMRIDNDGEGGILALMSLLSVNAAIVPSSSRSACSALPCSTVTVPSRQRSRCCQRWRA